MSIVAEVNRLKDAKTAIKTAIEGKGVTVPDATMLEGMAALIESIEAGGGFPNGTEWTLNSIKNLIEIRCANGIWVAGGYNTGIYYSTDGMTWTQSNITSGISYKIRCANGIWVAGTSEGIYYSTDGMTWNQSNITSGKIRSIYYANGIWVAGGSDSFTSLKCSIDGMTWTETFEVKSVQQDSIRCANGIWVAGTLEGIYYSTDGMTWNQSNLTSATYCSPRNANGIWCVCTHGGSDYGIYYSTDGMTWTQSNITNDKIICVYYANGIWVARSGQGKGIYYSTDGMTWTQSNITSGEAYDLNLFHYANGIWVAGGYNTGIYYSTDGMTWTQSNITSGRYMAFENANGIWVAGGYSAATCHSITWKTS